jgi:hypothetical protein
LIVERNVLGNGRDQRPDLLERPATEAFVGQVAEPSFHQVEPATGGGDEVQMKARMAVDGVMRLLCRRPLAGESEGANPFMVSILWGLERVKGIEPLNGWPPLA